VEAQLERVEIEFVVSDNDNLTIEHATLRERGTQRIKQVREVAVERFLIAALDEDLVAIAEDEGAEAVPFGLENPIVAFGKF